MLREVLESGVGQLLTLHASPKARNFVFLKSAFWLQSTPLDAKSPPTVKGRVS